MATISTIPAVNFQIKQSSGRKGHTERQAIKRPGVFDPNGFLKAKFGNLYLVPEQGIQKTELQFFSSVERVCAECGIPVPQKSDEPFPQNVSGSLRQLNVAIDRFRQSCFIGQDQDKQTCILTFEQYTTPFFLNFIPFRPICNIINAQSCKALKPAVLEISRYLCTQAQFKAFHPGSFAWEVYARMREWSSEYNEEFETEEEKQYNAVQIDSIDLMQMNAGTFFPEIEKPHSLTRLKKAIKDLKETPGLNKNWISVAEGFLNLATQYPQHTLHTHIIPDFYKNVEYDDLIELEQWACFIWSYNDSLFDRFEEFIQVELQEKSTKEGPVHIRLFNATGASAASDFAFETQLFDLLNQFVSLLNDYDHDEF